MFVLCICKQYDNLRNDLCSKIDFPILLTMTTFNKFGILFRHPPLAKHVGNFIVDAFDIGIKLEGVGLADNRPSTTLSKKKTVTHDM